MAEYIDIEPLRKQIVEFKTAVKQFAKSSSFLKAYISGIDAVMEAIDKLPITDVQEVKHGTWENTNTPNQLRCSNCEIIHFIVQYPHGEINYCPNCGTRMDGKDYEENDERAIQ